MKKKVIDLKYHLNKWDCNDLKTTACILELLEVMGIKCKDWKIILHPHHSDKS